MTNISSRQKKFLQSLQGDIRAGAPGEYVLDRFKRFLYDKPKDEDLDPQWTVIWDDHKSRAERYAPPVLAECATDHTRDRHRHGRHAARPAAGRMD